VAETGTLLVVDDDGVSRMVLAKALEGQGHTVLLARDGDEALALAAARLPALVILDVLMPGLDGYEVLTRLKSSEATREVPVIMISSKDDVAGIVKSVKLGADDFLFKPIDDVLLELRVRSCLERRRLRDGRQAQG
jgi:adenylate cyclase